MKISYDYDGVLTREEYRADIKQMLAAGYQICIVTSRKDQDPQVLAMAQTLGITEVHFTEDKPAKLKEILADAHFDDNLEVINKIAALKGCKTIGVHAKRSRKAEARRMSERY